MTPDELVNSIMFVSFAAISTTTFHCTHFIYDVAAHADLRAKMYEEQQQVIAKHGTAFSKEALRDMTYMEACLRETLRLNVNGPGTTRMARSDHTFSNGISIPAGRVCLVHTRAVNRDPDIYKAAEEYLPERAADQSNPHAATVMPGYVTFGMGPSACPARFFAVNELKMLMSCLLRRYDFTTASGKRPVEKIQRTTEYLPVDEPIIFTARTT
ncbi:cytochrome P450 [Thamnocephalis sphaerospora]|uniref:Cytochrome P450 n=1 Tax=Thamnocephalis sphaerospora TaxID=78915 RepID=A0A4P9XIJ7_9FUNG|nr:cytochrome P450 [Thamnocephalis sphaerospora]|eukprot:RKP05527.1 cytochrome P450 [Thamnocephalis sphaerospora]